MPRHVHRAEVAAALPPGMALILTVMVQQLNVLRATLMMPALTAEDVRQAILEAQASLPPPSKQEA